MSYRKTFDELSETGRFVRLRQERGIPLPPTMQRGTPAYIKSKCWNSLNQRCVNTNCTVRSKRNGAYLKRGTKLLFSRDEFHRWVDRNWKRFEALYAAGKTPSIDRIDNSKNYTIDNIRVLDLFENMGKDRRKAVVGVHHLTGDVKRYESAVAATVDGFNRQHISRAIKSGNKHRGYRWTFA